MDSDIKFRLDQIHFFDRLLLAAKCLEEVTFKSTGIKKPFGAIYSNQSQYCYHWLEPQSNGALGMNQNASYEINGPEFKLQEQIVWSSDGMGYAGGIFLLNMKLFLNIGGYRKFNKEYCGDDGLIAADMLRSGACLCILKTIYADHPEPNDDPDYLEWKKECMKYAFEQFDEKKYESSLNSEKKWIENKNV